MRECNQCGKCCVAYSDGGLSATADDIEGWRVFNPAVLDYVVEGKIWMDPVTGERLAYCPWLETLPGKTQTGGALYGCRIYHDRPEDCRHYPTLISEMARDGCEMLELKDLDTPDKAQSALDKLMQDSRPPVRNVM